jgi:hypothetical protein
VRVRCDVRDPIDALDAERLKGRRPAIAAAEEGLVCHPPRSVDDHFAASVEPARPPRKFHRGQWRFHRRDGYRLADARSIERATGRPTNPRGRRFSHCRVEANNHETRTLRQELVR